MSVLRQLLFSIIFLHFAYPQIAPTLQPALFYEDTTVSLRGSSQPIVDTNGNVIIITTQFSIDCPFGVCGTNIYSIAANGTPNWIRPTSGFASSAVNQIALGINNTIYFQDFAQLGQVLAYSSAGLPVPGWPVNLGFPLATGPHTLGIDPQDGAVLVKGGTSFSFSTFPGRVAAFRPDASLKWQADFANAANNTPGMIIGPNDAIYTYTDQGIVLAGDTGTTQCAFGQQFAPITGDSTGVFTYSAGTIFRINSDCTLTAIFAQPFGSVALVAQDNGILFALDLTDGSLFAIRTDGTFLWRNHVITATQNPQVGSTHNGHIYVIGNDVVDQSLKLVIFDENTGNISDAADITGLCTACGLVVAPNGKIYFNDLQSTRIYSLQGQFGTLSVTTDNAAATFVIADASGVGIQGSGTTFSQIVPAGVYTVTFNPVPGFSTPPPQSQILVPGGTITFKAHYVGIVPFLVPSQSTISFSYPVKFIGPPSPQNISLSSTLSSVSFQTGVATDSGGNWLFVQPRQGITPAAVSMNVRNGLAPGIYTGRVVVSAPAAENNPLIIPVSLTITPAPTPVLLVHGWCSDPATFGDLSALLAVDGFSVGKPFDYSQQTQTKNGESIEQLAGRLAIHVDEVLKSTKASQVDIVAHSMGGLITRAWMAGLDTGTIPYTGQIRRMITLSTPEYGATDAKWSELFADFLQIKSLGRQTCSTKQAVEMGFGSDFMTKLDTAWTQFQKSSPFNMPAENELFVAGTRSDGAFECGGLVVPHGCSDGIVEIASAVLKDSPADHIRYVPYKHTPELPGGDNRGVQHIDSRDHESYPLIQKFLSSGLVQDQCCNQGTIGYNPPHLRSNSKQQGLLIIHFLDAQTGLNIPGDHTFSELSFLPFELPGVDYNNESNSSTGVFVGVGFSAGQYDLTINIRGYRPIVVPVLVDVAKPTFITVPLLPQ